MPRGFERITAVRALPAPRRIRNTTHRIADLVIRGAEARDAGVLGALAAAREGT
jgi:hypothetical protein